MTLDASPRRTSANVIFNVANKVIKTIATMYDVITATTSAFVTAAIATPRPRSEPCATAPTYRAASHGASPSDIPLTTD